MMVKCLLGYSGGAEDNIWFLFVCVQEGDTIFYWNPIHNYVRNNMETYSLYTIINGYNFNDMQERTIRSNIVHEVANMSELLLKVFCYTYVI